jgi:hypothetical protein
VHLADASAHQSEQKNWQSKSGTEQAADKMGDDVCAPTDVLDHRTESNGEGIRPMCMNQEARIGNSDRRQSAGRKNRAGGTGVLTGSLYERIQSALSQIRSKTKNRTEKSRLGSTRNEISETSHSTPERKNPGKEE